jgi:hypothetical protein
LEGIPQFSKRIQAKYLDVSHSHQHCHCDLQEERIIESDLHGIPEASHPFDKNERSENEERMFEALRKLNNRKGNYLFIP